MAHGKWIRNLNQRALGRVEQSKRQDWCLEVPEKLHPMVRPICLYTVDTLVLEPNVLRDSVLMRLKCMALKSKFTPMPSCGLCVFKSCVHLPTALQLNLTLWNRRKFMAGCGR